MTINAYKFLLLITCVICSTVLLALGSIEPAVGASVITGATMYGLGNGIQAARGRTVEPVVAKRGTTQVVVSDDATTIVPPKVAD